jgi:hypothetical protein
LEVEIQVSARSDLLIRDVIHLRDSLERGRIDVGTIVVARAENLPLLLIAIEHDGAGPPLPKQKKA